MITKARPAVTNIRASTTKRPCTPISWRRPPTSTCSTREGESVPVTMHDGSRIVLRKVDKDYDPTDRGAALARIRERLRAQEYLTGLLHISTNQPEFHELNATPEAAAQSDSLRQAQSGRGGAGQDSGTLPLGRVRAVQAGLRRRTRITRLSALRQRLGVAEWARVIARLVAARFTPARSGNPAPRIRPRRKLRPQSGQSASNCPRRFRPSRGRWLARSAQRACATCRLGVLPGRRLLLATAAADQFGELVRGHGGAVMVALVLVAPQHLQELQLLGSLDPSAMTFSFKV